MYISEINRLMRVVLKNDSTLTSLVSEIYDTPPEAPTFPFMTTGESQSFPNDTMGARGKSHTISINCWSNVSKAECRKIVDTIEPILSDASLSLASGNRAVFVFSESVTTFEPENRLFRGMIRFRVHVYPEK